jgi:hypothetical protein
MDAMKNRADQPFGWWGWFKQATGDDRARPAVLSLSESPWSGRCRPTAAVGSRAGGGLTLQCCVVCLADRQKLVSPAAARGPSA